MKPLILTLAVLTASCALTTLLALCWGRRQLRPSTAPAMLLADPAQWVHRQRYLRARAEARQRQRVIPDRTALRDTVQDRAQARQRHPLRLHHIRVGGQPLTHWLRLIGGGLLLTLILLTLAYL